MGCSGQGSPLNRRSSVTSVVPENNLPRICATHQQVRMKPGKTHRHHWRLEKTRQNLQDKKTKERENDEGDDEGKGGRVGRVPNYAKDCGNSSFILQHHKQSALERKALAFVVTAFPSIFTFIEFLVPLQCLSHETCPNAYIFSDKILCSGLTKRFHNYLRRPITDSKETTIFCFTCKTAPFVVMWQQRDRSVKSVFSLRSPVVSKAKTRTVSLHAPHHLRPRRHAHRVHFKVTGKQTREKENTLLFSFIHSPL